ncbi:MAG: hypothetical protein N3D11_00465 [Candidatus Sumerlaeia bacterium]|nr:hypothetical protein [Candidatus Sumerlaeia bacterium]
MRFFEKTTRLRPRTCMLVSAAKTLWTLAGMLAAVLSCATTGFPCDTTVRGKAFEEMRDIHRLIILADENELQNRTIAGQLRSWLAGPARLFNAELLVLDPRDEKIEWLDYGIPGPPPELPAVALIGRDRARFRSFVIAHWEPAPTGTDLELLTSSPLREAIKRDVVGHWAVLLYAPAAGPSISGTPSVLEEVQALWTEKHPPGITILQFDRTDPREKLLASFIGLEPDGPEWVGIVFGRGKMMIPPLEGEEITTGSLNTLLGKLVEICSCVEPPSMLGVDIPMTWEPTLEPKIVSLVAPEMKQAVQSGLAGSEIESGSPRLTIVVMGVLVLSMLVVGAVTLVVSARRRPVV